MKKRLAQMVVFIAFLVMTPQCGQEERVGKLSQVGHGIGGDNEGN